MRFSLLMSVCRLWVVVAVLSRRGGALSSTSLIWVTYAFLSLDLTERRASFIALTWSSEPLLLAEQLLEGLQILKAIFCELQLRNGRASVLDHFSKCKVETPDYDGDCLRTNPLRNNRLQNSGKNFELIIVHQVEVDVPRRTYSSIGSQFSVSQELPRLKNPRHRDFRGKKNTRSRNFSTAW